MSKYVELCNAYTESRSKFANHRNECIDFAEKLIQGLVEYYSIPKEQIKVFPISEKPDPDRSYSIKQALQMAPDFSWHIGIEITLVCDTCEENPVQPVMINLGIKKDGDIFRGYTT